MTVKLKISEVWERLLQWAKTRTELIDALRNFMGTEWKPELESKKREKNRGTAGVLENSGHLNNHQDVHLLRQASLVELRITNSSRREQSHEDRMG